MSLKAFHVVFITASSALAVGCGIWSLRSYASPDGRVVDLIAGILALCAGAALLVYERYFLRKTKDLGYL